MQKHHIEVETTWTPFETDEYRVETRANSYRIVQKSDNQATEWGNIYWVFQMLKEDYDFSHIIFNRICAGHFGYTSPSGALWPFRLSSQIDLNY